MKYVLSQPWLSKWPYSPSRFLSLAQLTPSPIRLRFLRINGYGTILFNELLNNAVHGRPNHVVSPPALKWRLYIGRGWQREHGVYALPHPGVEVGSPLWTPHNAIGYFPSTPTFESHVPRDVHYKLMMAHLVTV